MPPTSSAADRIGHLKSLQVRWRGELEQLVRVHPDRAVHLAEALDDLKTLIGSLEAESRLERGAPPSSGVS